MAENTTKTYLFISSDKTTWRKICEIKDYPDEGGEPEKLETTTLGDEVQTYIDGVGTNDAKEFTANYDLVTYKEIKELKGTPLKVCLSFGLNGAGGQFVCDGTLNVSFVGKGVNEVREMKITFTPSSAFTLSTTVITVE